MQFRFAFSLYFSLLGCSWDVDVGPQGRYEEFGKEGTACVSGVQAFYDAGPGAIVDRLDAVRFDEAAIASNTVPPVTFLGVAVRTGEAEEIRTLPFRFSEIAGTNTIERVPGANAPFSGLIMQPLAVSPIAYFAHADAVGAAFGSVFDATNMRLVPRLAPGLMQAKNPILLGFLAASSTGWNLVVQTDENGGTVRAVGQSDSDSSEVVSSTIVAGGVLAAFPWSRGGVADYLNYAELTPGGVVLHSVKGSDHGDTTTATLPDATSSFTALYAVGRVLFFQYVPKDAPAPPASLPLLSVDLGSNDLGPNAPGRVPRVVTPALAAKQDVVVRGHDWMIAMYTDGNFARVSLTDGAITALPQVKGAIAFAYDTCNLYWVTKDSSVVMAMPLPGSAK